MTDAERVPVTLCWHCDRALDAASPVDEDKARATPGAISLCMYCGAIAVFGSDLRLLPPTAELLMKLEKDKQFGRSFIAFSWGRQFLLLRHKLLHNEEHPDR